MTMNQKSDRDADPNAKRYDSAVTNVQLWCINYNEYQSDVGSQDLSAGNGTSEGLVKKELLWNNEPDDKPEETGSSKNSERYIHENEDSASGQWGRQGGKRVELSNGQ